MLDNRLSYTAGYFFYHLNGLDVANVTVLPEFGQPTLNNNARILDTSNAGYVQASYKITPTINFAGGLRYTSEQNGSADPQYEQIPAPSAKSRPLTGSMAPVSPDTKTTSATGRIRPVWTGRP